MGSEPLMRRRTSDDAASARLFGKRAALGICVVVSVWFMVASVAQIVPAVFGVAVVPLVMRADATERRCAEGIQAAGATATQPSPEAPGTYADGPIAACRQTAAGLDALAALERLQVAAEHLKGRDPASVERLRRELSAHLPAEMR
jgi:hypothetical protein